MITSLIDLFYPKVCACCDEFLLHAESVICTTCRHALPLTNHFSNPDNEAAQKFYGKIPIEFAGAFVYYHKKGMVQQMIQNLKYRGREEIGSIMGYWLAEELMRHRPLSADAVIPVPLHQRKLRERGYNQVEMLSRTVSESLEIPYNDRLLVRNVYSKTQTRKNLLGRTEAVGQSLFGISDVAADSGKHFLLIDDVLTTGSTLEACCRALMQIDDVKISIACLAMSHS